MNVKYALHNIAFEWDGQKASANLHKHGISFELACESFFDPFLARLDDEVVEEELREKILGMTANWKILYVVYVMRDEIIRIVSARLATPEEKETYENQ